MSNETRPAVEITQLADQLIGVANELLELAGRPSARPIERGSKAPIFQAEIRRFQANGEFVDLSEIEAQILDTLLQSRGSLVTKGELCKAIGLDPDRQERNLKSYIYRLKAKVNKMQQPGVKIRPIHGSGYVLSEVGSNQAIVSA